LVQRHRCLVDLDGTDQAQTDDDEVVAALLPGDELGEADGAAGTWNVHHLHARRQPVLLQHLLGGTGKLVVPAARAGGGDDLHTLDLRLSRARQRNTAGKSQREHRSAPETYGCGTEMGVHGGLLDQQLSVV
jgi:hypothetical protein